MLVSAQCSIVLFINSLIFFIPQMFTISSVNRQKKKKSNRTGRGLRSEAEMTIIGISVSEKFYSHLLNLDSVLHLGL